MVFRTQCWYAACRVIDRLRERRAPLVGLFFFFGRGLGAHCQSCCRRRENFDDDDDDDDARFKVS